MASVTLGDLSLTGTDEFGVEWHTFAPLTGWDGSPASTIQLAQRLYAHGAWNTGPRKLPARTIAISGAFTAPDEQSAVDALDRLNAAARLDGTTLAVERAGQHRTALVFRQDEVLPSEVSDVTWQWSVQLVAPDPRKYGDPIVQTATLPSSTGGLTWPITWPITWTGVTNTGTLHIDNPGNIASPVLIRIDGPVQGPVIRHVSSGTELVFASNYTLAAGSWLDIDMENRTVLEAGTASRNGSVIQRGWFQLDPGANDIIFGAQVYNSTAQMTVTTTPAYL